MLNRVRNNGDTVKYPSKIGVGLLLFVLFIFGAIIFQMIKARDWAGVAIQFGILLLLILVFYSISYEIHKKALVVNSFFWFKKSIPIEEITGIVETNNPISSPAASLDRLEIFYGKYKSIIISPKEKMAFIEHLKSISPSIIVKMKNKKK